MPLAAQTIGRHVCARDMPDNEYMQSAVLAYLKKMRLRFGVVVAHRDDPALQLTLKPRDETPPSHVDRAQTMSPVLPKAPPHVSPMTPGHLPAPSPEVKRHAMSLTSPDTLQRTPETDSLAGKNVRGRPKSAARIRGTLTTLMCAASPAGNRAFPQLAPTRM